MNMRIRESEIHNQKGNKEPPYFIPNLPPEMMMISVYVYANIRVDSKKYFSNKGSINTN